MATPELRFKGFEGEWSEKQLEEVANRVTKKNTDNAISETFTNSAGQGIVSQLDFFTHSVSNQANISGYYVVSPEDFVYNPRISQKAPYGPINRNKNGRTGVISPLYSVFSINGLNHRFSEWFFKSSRWHDFMRQNGDSGARHDRFSIGSDEFFKMPINIPNASEQKEIGVYLESLENSCVASASAVQKIKLLKQSMLVKMFPQDGASVPEVRFEGFTGDWSGGKLGDATSEFTYGLNAAATTFDGETKYLRITDIDDQSRRFINENATSPSASAEKIKPYFLQQNDILFARTGASVGKTFIYKETDGTMVYAGFLIRAKINDNYSPDFVFQFTQSSNYWKYIKLVSQRSGQPGVNASEYANCPILFPSKEEQTAIGSYFRQLDKLIELEEAKLAKLTQLKTAFLAKMFV